MADTDNPANPPKSDISSKGKDKGKSAVMFGAALNFENTRKYSFDGTGTSKITAKLVAVPAPSAFMEAIAESLRKD